VLGSQVPYNAGDFWTSHYHHHISVMELGHLLTRSGLTYPEVSSKDCHDSFCQLGNSVSLPWVIYYGAGLVEELLVFQQGWPNPIDRLVLYLAAHTSYHHKTIAKMSTSYISFLMCNGCYKPTDTLII